MSTPPNTAVQVVIGAGSIGQAIARRTGAGKHVLLADSNETTLQEARTALEDAGHTVTTQRVDVSDRASVHALARAAADLGDVVQVVSTAGVSPVQAPAEAVLAVDVYGTAVVLEEFGKVIAPGGAGVHISSMAGHMPRRWTPGRRTRWPSPRSRSCSRCRSSHPTRCRTPAPPTPSPSSQPPARAGRRRPLG
ncbi:SDR family NAD(P)-dependent oxidoreductase [Geodermatophilus maliterrae]|uniref:SDR family NAD(P)-dependent oxidoreductase n=1 Tax=Geodermatophilus maliterrae TaxID=3162531 RepID=A0ABV3XM89_9ACTN